MTNPVNNTAAASVYPPTHTFLSSLQGLRTVAFLAIFISHSGLGNFGALGAWGVSVFFALSGFVMFYSYCGRSTELRAGIAFAYGKIKRLYGLHIVTMAAAALYSYFIYGEGIRKILTDMLLHAALIQVWIPNGTYYSTLNGLAWYLAVCAFLYAVFPLILKRLRSASRKSTAISLVVLVALQAAVSAVACFFGIESKSGWFSMQWITYYCPLARLIDFAAGCCLGKLFVTAEKKALSGISVEILQTAVLGGIVLSCFAYAKKVPFLGSEFIKYTLLFTPTTLPLIWLTARETGWLSKALAVKAAVRFADLTPYTFLIHGVAIKYCRTGLRMLSLGNVYAVAAVAFVISVAAAAVWKILSERLRLITKERRSLRAGQKTGK